MGTDIEHQIGRLKHGDHLCLLYESGEEQMAAAIPFIRDGLAAGECCAFIADEHTAVEVSAALARLGVDVDRQSNLGSLLLLTKRETYLRGGTFDPAEMVEFLARSLESAVARGFTGFRVTGEMSWALGQNGIHAQLIEYEALLNRFFPGRAALAICQYNLRRFSAEVIHDVLRTHPIAVIGDQVCPNIYYEPPEMVLGTRPASERVAWMIGQLRRARSAEQSMEEAHRKAVESDRRKDDWIAMLAHELRNPLATVRNALQVMQDAAPGSSPYARAQETAGRQLRHQARIVDDLLDVSRLTRGKMDLRREQLDLAALVREAVEDHLPELAENGLDVALTAPAGPVLIRGDATRLSQVVANLLQNAIRFTPRGKRIEVELAEAAEPAGRCARLRVADPGVGISAAMLPHLFEAFEQADRTLERARGGLGLGLALVKGLVELHGGRVWAHSAGEGLGAEFTVSLPINESTRAQRPANGTSLPGGQLRVLIVEDGRDAAETLHDLLELWGYTVAVAYSGPEAIEAARRFAPDVMLCDIGLPGMDGYAVARLLREDAGTRRTRMVALTGYGQGEDRLRAAEAGFHLHLTKPVDPQELKAILAGFERKPASSGRPRSQPPGPEDGPPPAGPATRPRASAARRERGSR